MTGCICTMKWKTWERSGRDFLKALPQHSRGRKDESKKKKSLSGLQTLQPKFGRATSGGGVLTMWSAARKRIPRIMNSTKSEGVYSFRIRTEKRVQIVRTEELEAKGKLRS